MVFRGETMFTHSLLLKGYKLVVTPKAITWHFQSKGGIHDGQKIDNWNHDEWVFQEWLKFKKTGKKLYVLAGGRGDHYMFRQAITPEPDSMLAVCYPDVFPEYKNLISIADAEKLVDKKDYDVYAWCERRGWRGTMVEAFKQMYQTL